ncbi:sushi, von Willebrand factor type A, EGF and pentraxin domain-containing protein 1-like isoform X2 [Ostrea edulis]|uniref:sushi, von Willebrand factor type A, EGF and pentraxin domain-containing protein 1-like isoform X2 n=1 Tax=Ostrea edulis TaxID=37623 RepID=UPI0024AFD34D|nr:sushi, von Willebrand factor type A, EGF and pentraxin domain-containing protein 1-like isoform X2 [Ostrea edulis]
MELNRLLLVFTLCLISRTLAFETKKLSQPLQKDILTLKSEEPVRIPSETRIRQADEEEGEYDTQCGDLPVVHCGHYTGTSHAMGQTWKLQCDPGCRLVGSGDITCLAVPDPFHHVAIWDHMQGMSKCEKSCCGVPPAPAHGYTVGKNYDVYQNVTIKCDPGYHLNGSDTLQCLPVANPKVCGVWVYIPEWTDTKCLPLTVDSKRSPSHLMSSEVERKTTDIQCGDLPVVHCGHYTGTSHAMGQTWKLQCDPGCYLVGSGDITCLAVPDPFHHVAIWDHTQGVSKCEQSCCGVPPAPAHGYTVGKNFDVFQNVTVKCDPGYYLNGSDILQCLPVPNPKACGVWVYVTQWTDSNCVPLTGDAKRSQPYLMDTGVEQKSTDLEAEDDICLQPKNTGPCKARMKRFYFNSVKKICEEFIYGGCKKNDNNFKSLEECKNKCIGN